MRMKMKKRIVNFIKEIKNKCIKLYFNPSFMTYLVYFTYAFWLLIMIWMVKH